MVTLARCDRATWDAVYPFSGQAWVALVKINIQHEVAIVQGGWGNAAE